MSFHEHPDRFNAMRRDMTRARSDGGLDGFTNAVVTSLINEVERLAIRRGYADETEVSRDFEERWCGDESAHDVHRYTMQWEDDPLRVYACPGGGSSPAEQAETRRQRELADMLAEALRLTRDYVGAEMLPAVEGWSWYDALERYLRERDRDPQDGDSADPPLLAVWADMNGETEMARLNVKLAVALLELAEAQGLLAKLRPERDEAAGRMVEMARELLETMNARDNMRATLNLIAQDASGPRTLAREALDELEGTAPMATTVIFKTVLEDMRDTIRRLEAEAAASVIPVILGDGESL